MWLPGALVLRRDTKIRLKRRTGAVLTLSTKQPLANHTPSPGTLYTIMLKSIIIIVNKNSRRRIGNFRAPLVPHSHQFNTKGPLLSRPKIPWFNTKMPQFNTSLSSTKKLISSTLSSVQRSLQFHTSLNSTQKTVSPTPKTLQFNTFLSSTPKNRQFSNNNPSVQHTPQFSTPLSSTYGMLYTSQFNTPLSSTPKNKPKGMLNWGVSFTEGCVELKGFGVELTDFGCWKGVVLVWKWGVLKNS